MRELQWGRIGLFVFATFLVHGPAAAQDGPGLGIGPRITFRAGDPAVASSSPLRVVGGQLKMRLTPKAAVELSADYRSSLDDTRTARVKSLPFQASLLVFPVRSAVSPYVLGGLGWYSQSITTQRAAGVVGATESIREIGYHGGIGAEARVGKRIAIHADYRYTRIRFGGGDRTPAATSERASRIPVLTSLQQSLKLSHQAAMWNWGLTFFF